MLRFMGYHVTRAGRPRLDFADEVVTTIEELVEGTCVKHRVGPNLLKMYDKFGQILRLENLLINVRDFKVFRRREGQRDGSLKYLRLRKSVADIHRRADLGRKINERFADALATAEDKTPLGELVQDLGRPTKWKGRPVRAINPLAPADAALLEAINRGKLLSHRGSITSTSAHCQLRNYPAFLAPQNRANHRKKFFFRFLEPFLLNPELITQAETIEDAFANARDAAKALRQSRAKLARRSPASRTAG